MGENVQILRWHEVSDSRTVRRSIKPVASEAGHLYKSVIGSEYQSVGVKQEKLFVIHGLYVGKGRGRGIAAEESFRKMKRAEGPFLKTGLNFSLI